MPPDLNYNGSLSDALLSLARILLVDQTVDQTHDAVARLAHETIPGCDAASITVIEVGRPRTSASTSALAWDVDQRQYGSDQGPCLDAIRLQTAVRVDSFASETRWPELSPAALGHGARSSLSLPLLAGDEPVGALNLYSRIEAGLVAAEGGGYRFATQAAITLANATALHRAQELAHHLSIALERRDVIGQAKGILMAQGGLSPEEAFDVLRRASQRSNRKLHDLATEMVERRSAEGSAK
ncbi:MAG: GAF and ANTAR domain-containing protein [Actinomycetota bacterium]|nr:GAF and ANTAR domain-containing protein [Actinomycetota bacterium]